MLIGIDFTLLGADLNAGYMKTENGYKIYLVQPDSGGNEAISIAKLVEDVKTLVGGTVPEGLSEKAIQDKISAAGDGKGSKIDFTKLRIKLTAIYLKVSKEGETTNADYAFRFDILADGIIPESIKVVNITSVTIAVWNTTNEKVLQQLAISADI